MASCNASRSFRRLLNNKNGNKIFQLLRKNYQPHPHATPPVPRGRIVKPLIFTAAVGSGAFVSCSILQYERVRANMHNNNNSLLDWNLPADKAFDWRRRINQWWTNLNEGQKIASYIIALNCGVFLCWQLPGCRVFLNRWFTASPESGKVLPMLLSCFSHAEIWHLGANMVVFWSFAPLIHHLLGTEQFVGFYVAGGVFSSLISHYFKLATASTVASVGASGALLAVLAACCIERPEARLSILFLPFFTFSAKTALYGIITFDLCGMLFRWKLFDHAGHLGGVMFGSWYVTHGHALTWDKRAPLVNWWHNKREQYTADR